MVKIPPFHGGDTGSIPIPDIMLCTIGLMAMIFDFQSTDMGSIPIWYLKVLGLESLRIILNGGIHNCKTICS